jgi:hypothetical protein
MQAEAYNDCKRPDSALRARASEESISVDVQDCSSIKACSEAFDANFFQIAGNVRVQHGPALGLTWDAARGRRVKVKAWM